MERWSSRLGFLLAATGAAVGLGNVWRFSSVVGANGGGAYLVPYLFAAFAFAVPLLILEVAVGRRLRLDVVSAFRSLGDRFAVVGWVVVGSVLLVLSYYLVITGWVLAFFVGVVAGVELTFEGFTATYRPVATFLVVAAVTGGIVALGVRDGIERMSKTVVPLIFVLLVALAGYATTLPGFGRGLSFLFTPDLSVLGDPLLWSAAFGQTFFSLSVGQGVMLTYGAYVDEGADLVRSALVIAVADIAVAILAGVVIFPFVFSFGLAPTAGAELAFSTLPRAFDAMPFGRLVAAGFFGLLVVAAVSSAVSLLEVGVAAAVRTTAASRPRAAAALTGGVVLVGLPSALSYSAAGTTLLGVPVLDALDETVGTLGLPLTGLLIAVAFTWYQDPGAVRAQVGDGAIYRIAKYVIPPVLIAVTVLRVLAAVEFPAWALLPGAAHLGVGARAGVTLAVLACLLAGAWVLVRTTGRGRR